MAIGARLKIKKRPMKAERRLDIMLEGAVKAMDSVGGQHVSQREKVIATWQNETPSWSSEVKQVGRYRLRLLVWMAGDEFGMKKWKWLDQGTRIRYATMTRGFRAKTTPRVISSKPGKGGLNYVSRRRPRKGIEKRLILAMTLNLWRP
jgi:hypothetical protein